MILEHEYLRTLWDDFFIEKDKETSKKLFKKFRRELLKHTQIEDEVLSPLFNKHLGIEKGQTTVMKEDHEKLMILLEKVRNTLDTHNEIEFIYKKNHFKRALIKHHKREISMQYPLFDIFILQNEWEEILQQILKIKG